MATTTDDSIPPHVTVRIHSTRGDEIDAWEYRPKGSGPHPAVVMAHGIGAVKAGGLAPFAERFRGEGYVAIVFDYRQWGASTGQPREALSVPRQLEDYRTVVRWARAQPDIDESQIFVWGTSFSGMHVVELAASDGQLAGAIAQAPLVDGFAAAAMAKPPQSIRLLALALADRVGSWFGRPPIYIPGAGAPGTLAVGATADALFGEGLMTPPDGTAWNNRVAARSLLSVSVHRPVRRAARIRCPILLVVAEQDSMAPVGPALSVVAKAPQGELFRSSGGHYDVYEGGASFRSVLDVELEFLRRHTQRSSRTN